MHKISTVDSLTRCLLEASLWSHIAEDDEPLDNTSGSAGRCPDVGPVFKERQR